MNAADPDILQQNFLKAFEGNEEKYPHNLEELFPGVFRKIVMLWGTPAIDDSLSHLLLDTRGGRAGFPEAVMTEIFNLQGIHDRLFPSGVRDVWKNSESDFDYDAVRQATQAAIKLNQTSSKPPEMLVRATVPVAGAAPFGMAGNLLSVEASQAAPLTAPIPKTIPKAIQASSLKRNAPDKSGITTVEQLRDALHKKLSPRFDLKLGEVLIQEKVITRPQMEEALKDQTQYQGGYLGASLIKLGYASEEEIEKTATKRLGFVFVNLAFFKVDLDAMNLVPYEVAFEHRAIPLCIMGTHLVVAVENPMTFQGHELLAFSTGKTIDLVGASTKSILSRLEAYGENKTAEEKLLDLQSFVDMVTEDGGETSLELADAGQDDENEADVSDNTVVKLVNKMISDAYDQGVSDIHLESKVDSKTLQIRFRKDGDLFPYHILPASYRNSVISRIKVMCQLNISERRKPQDGKILFNYPGKGKVELRVATVPTVGGLEDVVLRLLSSCDAPPLDRIGLSTANHRKLLEIVAKPYGILLVCGPTGSGKTTTLHSLLREISRPEIKIWTVEDPVEINQDHLCQVQVNEKIGLDFASVIRAFLRADPDVIMIGEMRDQETCKVALEASLTGHLVLSTLHTNSAAESITRLLEMGMEPYNFSDAMLGVLAQRLAKRLCPECKSGYQAGEKELLEMAQEYAAVASIESRHHDEAHLETVMRWRKEFGGLAGEMTLYRAIGCKHCNHTGFHGRFGLHELIVTSPEIKALIRERAAVPDILLQSMAGGASTLKQDGIEKVLQGITTLHEVRAACI